MGRLWGGLHDQNTAITKDLTEADPQSPNIEIITKYKISTLNMSKHMRLNINKDFYF